MNKMHVAKIHARVNIKKGIKTIAALVSHVIPASREDQDRVYVLMYHRVNSYRKDELSVPPDRFKKQVEWLRVHGFRNTRMAELESGSMVTGNNNSRVIFTFDDGYEDNYTDAYPILREYGYTAILYLPFDYLGTSKMHTRDTWESGRPEHNRLLNWNQVEEMLKDGMEIGSHTMSHVNLTRLSPEQARREIVESKHVLEQKLQVGITSFCYPEGYFEEKHARWVQEAGYRSACTTTPRIWQGHDLFMIPRVAVLSSDIFYVFRMKLLGRMEWFRIIR
ncbi:MAG: polysaccharide deacetylase family protein [Deltaproteobacteria bacterium]|nr:polysaccharide deacetylase family protein [Deltaproteobacteria bacterium]